MKADYGAPLHMHDNSGVIGICSQFLHCGLLCGVTLWSYFDAAVGSIN